MRLRESILLVLLIAAMSGAACSRVHNRAYGLFMGRVEAKVNDHPIVVTDCYRTSVPAPETITDAATGKPVYKYAPCRDAVIVIQDEKLNVNGKSYGSLKAGDRVKVDHGQVLVNGDPATELAKQ